MSGAKQSIGFFARLGRGADKIALRRNLAMLKRLSARIFVSVAALMALASSAWAHPHVWVSAQEEVIFGTKGQIEAIRGVWIFDEMYSAFVTQGQEKNGKLMTKEELAPLAKTNVEDLAEFEYFTHAKAANAKVEFGEPFDYSLEEREDKLVVLRFTLPLKTPASAAKAFTLQIYDPTYFVAFELAKQDPVSFVGAPKGCSANVVGAKPLAAVETQKLNESFFSGLSPGTDFGIKLATPIIIACP